MAIKGGSTIALACALYGSAALAQTAAEPGISALSPTTPPPPVTTSPVPSSPSLPQTSQGGLYSPYPLVPVVAPPSAPSAPSVGPAPGSQTTGPMGPAVIVSPANADPRTSKVIAGPPTPAGLGAPRAAAAMDLVTAFQLGQTADPTWRAALAERDVNKEQATSTIASYLPTASYTYSNVPTEGGARHVATFTQPIVSLGGIATLREKHPRRVYADATLEVRAQDLASRVLTAITDIIKANEATILNDARIEAFKAQSDRAEKLYRGGQGTVTDAEDISVRYQQALANRFLLAADQIATAARLRSITGVDVPPQAFRLPTQFGPITLQSADAYLEQQSQSNPQVEAARQTARINKLEAQRVKGSLLPVVGFSGTYTSHQGISESYLGISVSAPVSAGGFFQIGSANATLRKSTEEFRQVEEKAKTELARLYALVGGGRDALIINAKAIASAELAVKANSKSYEGGVRTNVDVINAIQTVFEVKNGYVQAAITLSANYLNLLLLAGEDPEDALAQTQRFLLGR
jgi:protease secretion system outer membrane protein